MSTIQITIDESISDLLGDSPKQIERHALELIVLELFRQRRVSVGRAAALLGLDQLAFIRWSGALGVPFFDMSAEDLEIERQAIEAL
jgi:predicted HTH domain antitoxin